MELKQISAIINAAVGQANATEAEYREYQKKVEEMMRHIPEEARNGNAEGL